MGKIINILGPHGVGKTTFQRYVRDNDLGIVIEGYQFGVPECGFPTKDDYVRYEMQYLNKINEDNRTIMQSDRNGFVIRSTEELEYFLRMATSYKPNESEIQKILSSGIKSDLLIYLDANEETLTQRINGDKNRDVNETIQWYNFFYAKYDAYFKSRPQVVVIKTDGKIPSDIYEEIMKALEAKK